MAHFPDSDSEGDNIPAQVSQIAELLDAREKQIAEREHSLADARAAFRRERDADRDRLAADRAEVVRLKRETKTLHEQATRTRERTKRLAYRYVRRVRQKWAVVRAEIEAQRTQLDNDRGTLSAEVARFGTTRSEFYSALATENERLRDGWASLEGQRRRASAEWSETNEFFAKQEAALTARTTELVTRESSLSASKVKLEKDTASLRQEAAGLEARIQHSRAVIDELEQKRDRLRADLLASVPLPLEEPDGLRVALNRSADRDLAEWVAELDARDKQIAQAKAELVALRAGLDREATVVSDQRRVLAEQFIQLATARTQWQDAERRTVEEMEELARGLRRREEEIESRDQWLVSADARRREEAHELWRLRLQLEAWQSKLTLIERQWHTERELRDNDYTRRFQVLTQLESMVADTFGRWERVRTAESERLQTEIQHWTDDRHRLAEATRDFDRKNRESLNELMAHASRALAAEQMAKNSGETSDHTNRRLEVMRKRWDKVFRKKLEEIEERRTVAVADLAKVDERYHELHRMLAEVADQETKLNLNSARAEARVLMLNAAAGVPAAEAPATRAATAELTALRDEVERMAAVLINAGVPEAPNNEIPWAVEEALPEDSDILPFRQHAQAA